MAAASIIFIGILMLFASNLPSEEVSPFVCGSPQTAVAIFSSGCLRGPSAMSHSLIFFGPA